MNLRMLLLTTAVLVAASGLRAQAPADYIIPAGYTPKKHWSRQIAWNRPTDAATVPGLVDQNNNIDSARLAATLRSISEAGGGVLYFGLGTYYLNFSLPLYDGAVIRGTSAVDSSGALYPTTRFVFPMLISQRGRRTDAERLVSHAPKVIFNASGSASVIGLANLDINRAALVLDGTSGPRVAGENTPYVIERLLLYNVRSNNAALLDPSVPTARQRQSGQGWQIWPDSKAANVNALVSKNYSIMRCRFNDAITDSVLQHDFLTDDGMRYDGTEALFRFAQHPALKLRTVEGKVAGEITDNSFRVSKGAAFMMINEDGATPAGNTAVYLDEGPDLVVNGYQSKESTHDLLFLDKFPSELKYFHGPHGDTLPYRLILPENYDASKTYPLVVYLHDFWDKGNDGKRHLRNFVWQLLSPENRSKYPCFIIAPQMPVEEPKWKPDGGLGSETWPLRATALIMEREGARLPVDPNRVYLIGHSMGGAGAIHFATHNPEKLAAMVAISAFYKFTPNAALQLAKVPSWLVYGAMDNKIPAQLRQEIRMYLRGAKADYKFTEVPGKAHRCWNTLTQTMPELLPWLFAQRR